MTTRCPFGHPIPSPLGGLCPTCFAALPAPPDGFPKIDGHDWLGELAAGGMGRVGVYVERSSGQERAVKVLAKTLEEDPEAAGRFRREFQAVAALNSDHVVRVHAYGVDGNAPWFSMTLIDGETLAFSLKAVQRPFGTDAVRWFVRVLAQVARGVHHAHTRGVFHRDLTPRNVLVQKDGHAVVIDFGCATVAAESVLTARQQWWTAAYAAPEVRDGRADRASAAADVYALGALLFELLTGAPPGAGSVPTAANFPRRVERDLKAICLKCLALRPESRFASAAEVEEELQRWLDGRPAGCRQASLPVRAWYAWHRSKLVGTALIAFPAAAVGGIYYGEMKERQRIAQESAEQSRARAADVVRVADAADAASRRGDWPGAAAGYDKAIAGNHPDQPRLEVAKLRALFSSNRLDGLLARIELLLADPAMADRRADLLLLRGELRLIDADRGESGFADVRAALDTRPALQSADAVYARGLLAPGTAGMLAHFRDAVTRDAAHRPARAGLVMGLLLTGRRAEARAELQTLRSLFPSDPLVPLAEGLLALYDGDDTEARAAFDRLAATLPHAQAEQLRRHASAVTVSVATLRADHAGPPGARPSPEVRNTSSALASLFKVVTQSGSLGLPQPVVAKLFEWARVYSDAAMNLGRPHAPLADLIAAVDAAAEQSPDAALLHLSAGLHYQRAGELYLQNNMQPTEEAIAELRRSADRGEAAAVAPSGIPAGTFAYQGRAMAAFAVGALNQPEFNRPDEARLRRNLREVVREGEAHPGLRAQVIGMLTSENYLPAEHWRVLLSDWGLSEPADPAPWMRLAELEAKAGNGVAVQDAVARAFRAALRPLLDRLRMLSPRQ